MNRKSDVSVDSRNEQGYTVIELIIVICILGVFASFAAPPCIEWVKNAEYRASARKILWILREIRSQAIMTNLEHRVEFENESRRYRVVRGNRPNNSTRWNDIVRDWDVLPPLVHLHATVEKIHLNPRGTANPGSIRIQDRNTRTKFEIRILNTGRARIL